ncbi:hypothetical protein Hypma_000255 [Hypsizygus marmoreus]|uniref:Uncharacterized protein n=1 Tax=Hypsizygus marmoreus TaxID=39966 RepID=A0A369J8Q6_HYPMA|nr:hypothetical protein Hypma_000255 [Hypsizygus marmoreus]
MLVRADNLKVVKAAAQLTKHVAKDTVIDAANDHKKAKTQKDTPASAGASAAISKAYLSESEYPERPAC